MPDPRLPAGAKLSSDQFSRPHTHAAGGFVRNPELEGIQTNVQHSIDSGKPASPLLGLFGAGLILTPDGPMVMAQTKHADGTSLGVLMTIPEAASYRDIFAAVVRDALQADHG